MIGVAKVVADVRQGVGGGEKEVINAGGDCSVVMVPPDPPHHPWIMGKPHPITLPVIHRHPLTIPQRGAGLGEEGVEEILE